MIFHVSLNKSGLNKILLKIINSFIFKKSDSGGVFVVFAHELNKKLCQAMGSAEILDFFRALAFNHRQQVKNTHVRNPQTRK